jgi:hypothetical protein
MTAAQLPRPRRAQPPIGKIRDIFLSATVNDLGPERDAVQNALAQRLTAVFLQDCWNRPAGDIVRMCCDELEVRSGYLGIFGFRYGWVPPVSDKSITELECDWALYRWSALSAPPVFFFSPAPGSVAEESLKASADAALAVQFPADEKGREDNKQRQKTFLERLGAEGRPIIPFKTLADLQVKATNAVSMWNEVLLERAANAHGTPEAGIPQRALGAIGRGPQIEVLERALLARDHRPDAPALAVIVHGKAGMGMRAFCSHLAAWDEWETDLPPQPGVPAREGYDVPSLIAWATNLVVARGKPPTAAGIEGLADAIIGRLAEEPVVLVLQHLEALSGGLQAFHRDFWAPLHCALRVRWEARRRAHRFAMVAMINEEQLAGDAWFWHGDPDDRALDYRQLLLAPPLTDLTKRDVTGWLHDLGLRRARSIEVANRVIGAGEAAEPLRVYEALQDSGVWNEVREANP